MIFEFEHHDGERWAHIGLARARGLRRPFDEALTTLTRARNGELPLGVYRVRPVTESEWHVGELQHDGAFHFDDELLVSLS